MEKIKVRMGIIFISGLLLFLFFFCHSLSGLRYNIKWKSLVNWDDGTGVLDKLFSVLICMFEMDHTKPLKKLKIICKTVTKKI